MTLPASSHPWEALGEYEGVLFIGVAFESVNLVGTTFRRVKFVRCRFLACDLSHATFSACDVYDSTFEASVLYFCQFENCELTKTRFVASYLSGIRIRSCDLTRAQFGREFPIGVNRKLVSTPPGGFPSDVLVSAHGSQVPQLSELESRFSGIAVAGAPWYVSFVGRDDERRDNRRRSVLAAHLANNLFAFGRGDAGAYHYLARRYAALAESRWFVRAKCGLDDWIWGYGYRAMRLLRCGLAFNLLVTALYLACVALGWGQIKDNAEPIAVDSLLAIAQCLYYCVVVATTLGFGDVLPYGVCRVVLVVQVGINVVLVALWLSTLTSPHRQWAIPEDLSS